MTTINNNEPKKETVENKIEGKDFFLVFFFLT